MKALVVIALENKKKKESKYINDEMIMFNDIILRTVVLLTKIYPFQILTLRPAIEALLSTMTMKASTAAVNKKLHVIINIVMILIRLY